MRSVKARVRDKQGLHLRPSADVVRLAQRFKSRITLCHDCKEANACSILQILCLGAGFDASVEIRATGPDEKEAVDSIAQLFIDGGGI
jgi:phosphocarrier protein HPr